MKTNICKICNTASFSLNRIGALHSYLDKSSIERLVQAFISSKLDYCNALLYGIPDRDINRLKRIQNSTARLVSGIKSKNIWYLCKSLALASSKSSY